MPLQAIQALTGQPVGDLKGVGNIAEIRRRVADALEADVANVVLMNEDGFILEDALPWPTPEMPLDSISKVLAYVKRPGLETSGDDCQPNNDSHGKTSRDYIRIVSGDLDSEQTTKDFAMRIDAAHKGPRYSFDAQGNIHWRTDRQGRIEGWTCDEIKQLRCMRRWDGDTTGDLLAVVDQDSLEFGRLVAGQYILHRGRPCEVTMVSAMPSMFECEWPASVRCTSAYRARFGSSSICLKCSAEDEPLYRSVQIEFTAMDTFIGEEYIIKGIASTEVALAKLEHSEHLLMDADDRTGQLSVLVDESSGECREDLNLPEGRSAHEVTLRTDLLHAFQSSGCVRVKVASWSNEAKVVGFTIEDEQDAHY